MTPHCGVNYGSSFRRRFLCFLSARSSLCNTLICEKSTEYSAFSTTLVGTTGLPRTKDLRLCDRTGQYDTTLWCQLRKHFPQAFLCFLSARSSLCNTLLYVKKALKTVLFLTLVESLPKWSNLNQKKKMILPVLSAFLPVKLAPY